MVADASQAPGAQVIPYDSLFVGGGAYSVSTNLPRWVGAEWLCYLAPLCCCLLLLLFIMQLPP